MKLLAIAGAIVATLLLAALLWPDPKPCDSVTYYAFGNAVTVTDPGCDRP